MSTEHLYFGQNDDGESWWSVAYSMNEAREELADRLGDPNPTGLDVQRVDPARILGEHVTEAMHGGWTVRVISTEPVEQSDVHSLMVEHIDDPDYMLQLIGELGCRYLFCAPDIGWATYIDGGEYRGTPESLTVHLAHFDALDTFIHVDEV